MNRRDCPVCGDLLFGLAVEAGIHPCCDMALERGHTWCAACATSKYLAGQERRPVPTGEPIPVEEWDWDEIRQLDRAAQRRAAARPRCAACEDPMLCGQTHAHHVCRSDP